MASGEAGRIAALGRTSVRVPASSANLGPGFDAFGLALGLYNRFDAELADEWSVEIEGAGADHLLRDAGNVVAKSMAAAFAEAGRSGLAAHITCANDIPTGRGLGSSSSAIVGGLMLGDGLSGAGLSPQRLLELATRIEGHPDNVAAAIFGGLTVCWIEEGLPHCARIEPTGGVAAVVAVAERELPTTAARAMLPENVPYADAAFNAGRAGLLGAALALGRAELLAPALNDRLHEPYRSAAIPDYADVRRVLVESGADGVALSGAGPTLIGLVAAVDEQSALARAREVVVRAEGPLAALGTHRYLLALNVDREGAKLER